MPFLDGRIESGRRDRALGGPRKARRWNRRGRPGKNGVVVKKWSKKISGGSCLEGSVKNKALSVLGRRVWTGLCWTDCSDLVRKRPGFKPFPPQKKKKI